MKTSKTRTRTDTHTYSHTCIIQKCYIYNKKMQQCQRTEYRGVGVGWGGTGHAMPSVPPYSAVPQRCHPINRLLVTPML